ncbi:MAG: hypothetical protein KAH64_06340 [Nitrosomonadaceae bacterium]|nr:hypothetical protein [Nitrosomonadaceae bacterium]
MQSKRSKRIQAKRGAIASKEMHISRLYTDLVSLYETNASKRDISKKVKAIDKAEKAKTKKVSTLNTLLAVREKKINRSLNRKDKISRTEYRVISINEGVVRDKKLTKKKFQKVHKPRADCAFYILETAKGRAKVIDFDGHIDKNSSKGVELTDDNRKSLGRSKFLEETKSSIAAYSGLVTATGALAGLGFSTAVLWMIKMYLLGGMV